MSLHPSYISPPIVFDQFEQSLSKPDRTYGIGSVLCALVPVVTATLGFLIGWLVHLGIISPWWEELLAFPFVAMLLCIPLCLIAGIVFGALGFREGERRYSITGLVLNTLIIVGVPALIAIAIVAGW